MNWSVFWVVLGSVIGGLLIIAGLMWAANWLVDEGVISEDAAMIALLVTILVGCCLLAGWVA